VKDNETVAMLVATATENWIRYITNMAAMT
jgi:hypothetical protein